MNFVTMRDRTLATRLGHVIDFKKGVPTYVPSEAWDDALAIGAAPEGELPESEAAKSNEPTDPAERKKAIFDAFDYLMNNGGREVFAASGVPNARSLNKQLGWTLDARERLTMWTKYLAEKGLD